MVAWPAMSDPARGGEGDDAGGDAALLGAARAGDAGAIARLLERYEPSVYRFGVRMCHDPEDARDVLQETLLSAARGLPGFRGDASVSTWLYTIARSFCIKKRRRSKFAPDHEASLDEMGEAGRAIAATGEGPEESAARREMGAQLERAIARLEEGQREVLLLRDVEGLTAPEVGEALGLSVEAVKSRLHRARASLRELLAPIIDGDDSGAALPPPGPDCPDMVAMFSRHLEGEIGPETCAAMEQHLAGCARCRRGCDGLRDALGMCRRAPGPVVPEPVRRAVRQALLDALHRAD